MNINVPKISVINVEANRKNVIAVDYIWAAGPVLVVQVFFTNLTDHKSNAIKIREKSIMEESFNNMLFNVLLFNV